MRWLPVLLAPLLSLSACDVAVETGSGPAVSSASGQMLSPEQAARSFTAVARAVEPVAEAECRRRSPSLTCDFRIVVDPDPRAPPNAFQSLDKSGQPVLTFTASMIATVQNADELAFVMGHEAAHHIASHLARQAQNAAAGAVVFAGLATLTGGGPNAVATAQELGAAVGARSYSKEFELEADQLGTVITYYAGFDPLVGAQFFSRIPDPGDRFLGTHPPNAARMEAVRQTARQLGLSG